MPLSKRVRPRAKIHSKVGMGGRIGLKPKRLNLDTNHLESDRRAAVLRLPGNSPASDPRHPSHLGARVGSIRCLADAVRTRVLLVYPMAGREGKTFAPAATPSIGKSTGEPGIIAWLNAQPRASDHVSATAAGNDVMRAERTGASRQSRKGIATRNNFAESDRSFDGAREALPPLPWDFPPADRSLSNRTEAQPASGCSTNLPVLSGEKEEGYNFWGSLGCCMDPGSSRVPNGWCEIFVGEMAKVVFSIKELIILSMQQGRQKPSRVPYQRGKKTHISDENGRRACPV